MKGQFECNGISEELDGSQLTLSKTKTDIVYNEKNQHS